ncbi:hypothetical protein [Mycobacterium phage WXIN]|nr:hypothetical protein [Mycobacterium phage WXIN]
MGGDRVRTRVAEFIEAVGDALAPLRKRLLTPPWRWTKGR